MRKAQYLNKRIASNLEKCIEFTTTLAYIQFQTRLSARFTLISEDPQSLPVVSIQGESAAAPLQDAQCNKSPIKIANQSDSVTTSPAQQSGETAVDALGDDDALHATCSSGSFFSL